MFRGLSHPLRRELLVQLKRGERTVGELLVLAGSGISMPTLSRHLAILRDAGLVRQRKDGQKRVYRIQTQASQKAMKWLKQIQ